MTSLRLSALLAITVSLGAAACAVDAGEADEASSSDAELSMLEETIGFDGAVERLDVTTLAAIDEDARRLEGSGAPSANVERFVTRRTLIAARDARDARPGAGPASAERFATLASRSVYDWDMWKMNGEERGLCRSARRACVRALLAGYVARETARATFDDGDVGGRRDALRHTLWNALMAQAVGERLAKAWADAHENGYPENRATARALRLSDMDFHNNAQGRKIGSAHPDASTQDLVALILAAMARGDLVAVRYDLGDRDGTLVPSSRCTGSVRCGS